MDAQAELAKRKVPTSIDDLRQLRPRLTDHLAKVQAVDYEFAQVELAERLATNLAAAIDGAEDLSNDDCATLGAAIAYFVSSKDAESDLHSPIGLEDDAFVVNEAFSLIGRSDLAIDVLDP
ncbi:MAG: DUF1232 domain-containing protein [Aquihabitans sp.]